MVGVGDVQPSVTCSRSPLARGPRPQPARQQALRQLHPPPAAPGRDGFVWRLAVVRADPAGRPRPYPIRDRNLGQS
jgi:hypothetical protein